MSPEHFKKDSFISLKEAGGAFGYTSDYLGTRCRSGELVCKRIGRSWFVDESSLKQFITMQNTKKEVQREQLSTQRKQELQANTAIVPQYTQAVPAGKVSSPIQETSMQSDLSRRAQLVERYGAYIHTLPVMNPSHAGLFTDLFKKTLALVTSIAIVSVSYAAIADAQFRTFLKATPVVLGAAARGEITVTDVVRAGGDIVAGATQNTASALSSFGLSLQSNPSEFFNTILVATRSATERFAHMGTLISGGLFLADGNSQSLVSVNVRSITKPGSSTNSNVATTDSLNPQYVTYNVSEQPGIERVVENTHVITRSEAGVSLVQLQQTENALRQEIARLSSANTERTQDNFQSIALTQRIDQLNGTSISNATISGASISSASADLTTLTVSGSASFAGVSASTITTTGNVSVGGSLAVTGTTTLATTTIAGGAITFSDLAGGVLVTDSNGVLSTTTIGASSIADDSLDFDKFSDTMTVDANTSIDTSSSTLTFNGGVNFASTTPATTTRALYAQGSALYWNGTEVGSGASLFTDGGATTYLSALTDNFAIGTTTASTKLHVQGAITLASTTPATTTNALYNQGGTLYWNGAAAGISTFLGLTDTQNAFTANRIPYTNAGGTALTDSSALTFNGTTLNITSTGSNATISNPSSGNGVILSAAGGSTTGQLRIVANDSAWADNASTAYFQIRTLANNNATFMGGTYGADAPLDRLQFDSEYTTITNHAYTDTPVATAMFEVVNDTAARNIMQIIGAGSQSGDYLQITSNGGTAGDVLTVDNSGHIGVGDTPTVGLDVFDTVRLRGSSSATGLTVDSSGNVGIGTTNPSGYRLYVDGTTRLLSDVYGGYFRSLNDGSASYAAFHRATDTNTGMFFPATDNLGLTTGGTERLRIADSGNVGIGTTSPASKLDVWGDMRVGTSSTPALFVDVSSGNVGIGESTPQDALHVSGTARIDLPAVSDDSYLTITSGTASAFNTYIGTTASNQYAWFTNVRYNGSAFVRDSIAYSAWRMNQVVSSSDAGSGIEYSYWNPSGTMSTKFVIKGTGNVGIGESSPSAKLHILGTSEQLRLGYDATNYQKLTVASDGGTTWAALGTDADLNFDFNGATDGDFSVNTDDLFVDTSSGYVGIGTTTPAYKLDVYGDARVQGGLIANTLAMNSTVAQAVTSATTTISASGAYIALTPDADYVLTSTPSIATPSDNQLLVLHNESSLYSIELQDNGTLLGSDILVAGANPVLAAGEVMILFYEQSDGKWHVISHPNSPLNVDSASSIVQVRNDSGSTIAAGAPVYVTGYNVGQGRVTIGLADADDSGKDPAIGLTTGSIGNNQNGTVIVSGVLSGINTSAYSVNDALYLSTTAGALTNVRPTGASDCVQAVARVTRANASGVVQVIGAGRCNDIPNSFATTVNAATFVNATTTNLVVTGTTTLATTTATALSATTGTFSGALSALSAAITNGISAASATITGALSAASATITGLLSTATLTVSDTATTTNLVATGLSSLATTTVAGDFSVNTDDLFVDTSSGYVGVGTSTPNAALDVTGKIAISGTQVLYNANAAGFTGSLFVGSGGSLLSHSSGEEGYHNLGVGMGALAANTTGSYNTAQGNSALLANTTGTHNTADGYEALSGNTTGNYNTAVGFYAGKYVTSPTPNAASTYSVYLGAYTKALASGDTNEIVIGYGAVGLGSDTVTLGNDSIATTALKGNIGIGTTTPASKLDVWGDMRVGTSSTPALFVDTSSGYVGIGTATPNNLLSVYDLIDFNNTDQNTKLGYQAGKNIVSGAARNTFVGYQAGLSSETLSTNTADNNTALGYMALSSNRTNAHVTAIGANAVANSVTPAYATMVGSGAGQYMNGYYNTGVGYLTLLYASGSNNVALGNQAQYDARTAGQNVAVGAGAMQYNRDGDNNVFLGKSSGNIGDMDNSVGVGYQSGYNLDGATGNILLGYQSGYSLTTGSNNIVIGYNTDLPATTTSNTLSIGNLIYGTGLTAFSSATSTVSAGNIGIGTTTPASKLDVWGDMRVGTSSTPALFVDTSSGNVGFGTAAPVEILHVNTSDTDLARFDRSGSRRVTIEAVGNNGAIDFLGSTGQEFALGTLLTNFEIWDGGYLGNGDLRFLIDSSGNVAIGTSTPQSKLDVWGDMRVGTSSTPALFVDVSSSNVGIGTATPSEALTIIGDASVSTLTNVTDLQTNASGVLIDGASDERLKNIQGDFTRGLEDILKINPILYTWKDGIYYRDGEEAGLSAQNVQEAIPEAVRENSRGYLSLSDRPILATAVNAIKELNLKIDDLVAASEASGETVDESGVVATILGWFENIGIFISESVAKFNNLAAAAFTVGSSEQPNGITLYDEETGEAYCVKIKGGEMVHEPGTCAEIATTQAEATVPTITIIGNNPAEIALNATYSDMGARAENADGDDLTVHTFVDGVEVDHVEIDTSTSTTYIITYTAEYEGESASVERTVIVGDGSDAEQTQDDAETDAEESDTATTTEETTEDATGGNVGDDSTATTTGEVIEEVADDTATSTDDTIAEEATQDTEATATDEIVGDVVPTEETVETEE